MKGTIRVDHISKNILISRAFSTASMHINSEEHKTLTKIKSVYSDYLVILREIKKNPQKESYRGLTYEYMERYIELHDGRNSKAMNEYKELRLIAECHSIRYAHIKKWFLKNYPEIEDFSTPTVRANENRLGS